MTREKSNSDVEAIRDLAAGWLFRRGAGLTPAELSEFESWRAADPRHAAALDDLEQAWSVLERPLAAGRSRTVLEQLGVRAQRRRRRRVAAVGSLCLLLVAGGTLWQSSPAPKSQPGAQVSIVAPATRTLSDGSVVELKSGAEIAVDFKGATRAIVLVRGEAHFQVAHDPKPFVVTAGRVEFRAVGTAFSVELEEGSVELLVTEGRVAVEKPGGNLPALTAAAAPVVAPATSATLATVDAGNRMVLATQAESDSVVPAPTAVAAEDMADQLSWRIPRIDFTRTPLAEAVALMNRHNRVQMTIDEPALGNLPVSGLFRADRVEAFVRLLEANFGIEATTSGQTIQLRKRR